MWFKLCFCISFHMPLIFAHLLTPITSNWKFGDSHSIFYCFSLYFVLRSLILILSNPHCCHYFDFLSYSSMLMLFSFKRSKTFSIIIFGWRLRILWGFCFYFYYFNIKMKAKGSMAFFFFFFLGWLFFCPLCFSSSSSASPSLATRLRAHGFSSLRARLPLLSRSLCAHIIAAALMLANALRLPSASCLLACLYPSICLLNFLLRGENERQREAQTHRDRERGFKV